MSPDIICGAQGIAAEKEALLPTSFRVHAGGLIRRIGPQPLDCHWKPGLDGAQPPLER